MDVLDGVTFAELVLAQAAGGNDALSPVLGPSVQEAQRSGSR
jgi:hypothetical protein